MSDLDDETLRAEPDRSPDDDGDLETIHIDAGSAAEVGIESIAHYRLERELGRGGQGAVFQAVDTRLQRRVALKILGGATLASPTALLRFRREAEIASRLDHPGICTVFDAGEDDGVHYIVMRFVDGAPLDSRIKAALREREEQGSPSSSVITRGDAGEEAGGAPDEVQSILRFFVRTLDALQAAHEAGLVHRDIKPGNIMVTKGGDPVILDFGLARADDAEGETITQSGDQMGTPAYMSPEQISRRAHSLDARTDVYSMGVSLYECLTLRRPHVAPTRERLYQEILLRDPPDPRSFNPQISADLKVVLDRALEKDPDRRYSSARLFASDLLAVIESRPVSARAITVFGRAWRWCRRRPTTAALILLALVAMLTAVGLGVRAAVRQPLVDQAKAARARAEADRRLEEAFLMRDAGRRREAAALLRDIRLDGELVPEALAALLTDLILARRHEEALDLMDENTELVGSRSGFELLQRFCRARLEGASEQEALDSIDPPQAETELDHFIYSLREESMAARDIEGAAARARDEMLEAVLRAEVARPLYHFRLAMLAAEAGDEKLVEMLAPTLVSHWPDKPAAHYWAGRSLMILGKLDEARPRLESALDLDGDFGPALRALAGIEYQLGETDSARTLIEKAIAVDPDDPIAHRVIAEMYELEGDHESAVESLRASLQRDPLHDDSWYALGESQAELGDFEAAATSYAKAAEIDPDYPMFHGRHAEALVALGRIDEARAAAMRALDAQETVPKRRIQAWIDSGATLIPAQILEEVHRRWPETLEDDDVGLLVRIDLLARAGFGVGRDAQQLEAERLKELRDTCRALLEAELEAWTRAAETGFLGRRRVRLKLEQIRLHPAFAIIRGDELLDRCDTDEAAAWRALARKIAALGKSVD